MTLATTFAAQRAAYSADPYPSAAARRANLKTLERLIFANQDAIASAINQDFGRRDPNEVLFSEIYVSLNAIRHSRRHVREWMAKRPRVAGWPLWAASAYVLPQPLGVIGVISPWNYPLFLAAAPIAGALAAGNRVMLKPSEHTPATSDLLARLLAGAFPADLVAVVTGDAQLASDFTRLPFDHLLFTGSTAIGKHVMRAAADNLTPVTLELGGKSPAIVAASAHLDRAAEDIVYGKLLNAGQTCIAPDYVFIDEARLDRFKESLQSAIERYWPTGDTTSIINSRQRERLGIYLEEARLRGVRVIQCGEAWLLIDPPGDTAVMREEIFGPILPIKPYRTLDDVIAYINGHDRPLALYLFATDRTTINRVTKETVSGGLCINDTLLHIAAEDLPFGGVGASGMGHYHGFEGFNTFSKLKPVFRRYGLGMGRLLRPPYGRIHQLLRKILIG